MSEDVHEQRRKQIVAAITVGLLLVVALVIVLIRSHAERVSVAELTRSFDRYDDSRVLLEGNVTGQTPKLSGVVIGYFDSFEIDDGTGKIGVRFNADKMKAPAAGAHVKVKARVIRPENVGLGGPMGPDRYGPATLIADSIE